MNSFKFNEKNLQHLYEENKSYLEKSSIDLDKISEDIKNFERLLKESFFYLSIIKKSKKDK